MQHISSSFTRPPGLEPLITIVHDASAWPAHVSSFSKTLLGTAEKHDNVTPVSHQPLHDTTRIENQLCPASMPALEPDFQGCSIAMFVKDVLSQTVPELIFHYNATYAIAVYPCCSSMMPAPVMPARGLATMFATKPIDLARHHLNLDATTSADTAQAHLLLPQYRNGSVPLALLCVAPRDEIYSAMSSALLQRRALGIVTPLLGLAFNDSVVHLILGWYTASQSHRACCDIHLAHGAVKHTANHGLGRFDISSADSTQALAQVLLRLSSQLCSGVADARLRTYSSQETALGELVAWRADVKVCELRIDAQARAMQWLSGIEASASPDVDIDQLQTPVPGANPIDALNTLLLQKRKNRLAYPINKDWENASFLAKIRQLRSSNAAEIEILAENQVQPCAWPAPDFPDDHYAVDPLAVVHRDVLSCLDFSDLGGDMPAFLNDINRTEWDQYKEEVALEARMRKDCNLPGLFRAAGRTQDDMVKILPLIFRLSEDALAVGHTPGARMPWERLLAACLRGESSSRVSHEWRVAHPRNIFFDRVHDTTRSANAIDRREAVSERCRALADGLISLCWIYPDSNLSAEETSVPEWLHTAKSTLSEALQGETIQRIKVLDAWATRHAGGHTDEVDLRVLNAQASDICDAVAYLSIPVPDLALIGDRQWRQWDDFCIIGQCSRKRQYSSSISVDDMPAPQPQDGGDFVVTDPVLREVRRMGATAGPPVGMPEPLPAHPGVTCEGKGVDNPEASGNSVDVPLPYLWLEDNTYPFAPSQTFNRARSNLLSTIRFYLALGIYDVIIFALVTIGSCAHLLCGWGTDPSEEDLMNDENAEDEIIIVDNNCPVWDLRDKSQAVRFCAFLLQLRQTHLPKLRQAFEARKEEFTRAWMADPTAARFQWTMKHQQSSPLVCDLRAERKRQVEASEGICSAMETIERGMTHAEVRAVVREDPTAPAYLAELDDSFARIAEPNPRLVELRHKACTQLSESCSCPFHRLAEVPVDVVDNDV